ncbi:alkaline phosphatase D family protein [Amycolatopsis palatopharyngis]|uniref:alkaline phosphatase D family protein n=1 Tax=Amycolatopsis palatopharyngis TaxID=187982 RepID=UPI000E2668C9|nr:alkaline phosphatase D family protein [Amycolatopsis palatopharyngis]
MSALSRRDVLRAGGTLVAVAGTGLVGGAAFAAPSGGVPAAFAHGVASGDPLPDGVLLWTRVTPTEDARPGSGAGPDVRVQWEVALDEGFRTVVAQGDTATGPARDHTVKVDVRGLDPDSWYWYRFRFRGAVSPAGRTRTAPAAGAPVDRLRMGVVSCANWQAGHFAAYRHLAHRQDLDLVLHLGDYLYEYAPGEYQARDTVVRPHDPPIEMTVLEHYRRRHAQYKTDPDLQALHAHVPFVVTWDDHESANDAWSGGAENHTEPAEGTWADRRAASQQAYAEWMPVRYEAGGRLYRRFTFGSLAELSMLDLRTYRSKQVDNPLDRAADDPDRTITGDEQLRWLTSGLVDSGAQWKLVGNPVMIAPVRFPSTLSTRELQALSQLTGPPVEGAPYNVDQWDGYTADRTELFSTLRDHGVQDTVFLTGDIHSAWACELPADPLTYPLNRNSVGTELVCTSVTSDNLDDILRVPPRTASLPVEAAIRANNPHIKHLEFDSHGYSVIEVSARQVQMDWFELADRTDPGSSARHAVSFAVPASTQRVQQVREPLR